MAKIVKNNIDYTSTPSSASMLPYDNFGSGLDATNVQDAIDEIAETGGGGGAKKLSDLTDVDISGQTVGQVLKYNGYKWANADESGGDLSNYYTKSETNTLLAGKADSADVPQNLQDLDNVTVTSATNGQVLKYNGSNWVNANESGGGSTVSVTQIQTTGTKIATISVDSVDTDLYAPNGGGGASSLDDLTDVTISSATDGQVLKYDGTTHQWINGSGGGGSGGHTIVDDAGTDLTQRTNLQFKGAYSEDNSTDDTTEVNVVREMTKAEFDLLSDDEKVGFINITDITEGSYDRFQPIIYSGDEREIGVWIDGKPLYEKSLSPNVTSTSFTVDVSALNIENMVSIEGSIFQTSTNTVIIPYSISTSDYALCYYNNNYLKFAYAGAYNTTIWKLKIRYTKTTDTAGSGQWTPQGVPAKHYSTVEHVIGTWNDGSPLYERSYAISHSSFTTGWKWFSLGVVCDKLVDAEVELKDSQATYCYTSIPVAIQYSDGAIGICNNMGGTMGNVSGYVTIRYTKSS